MLIFRGRHVRIDFGNEEVQQDPNDAEFILAPPTFWQAIRILLGPNFWVGETFVSGGWYLKKGDLSEFLRTARSDATKSYGRYFAAMAKLRGIRHYVQQYLLTTYVTRKVRHHYDVDSELYRLFLDDEMVYTCGFFDDAHGTLAEAQQAKIAAVISRMNLPTDNAHILDIGCGWGAIERAIVKFNSTATVCGLSISNNQLGWAQKRDASVLSTEQINRIEYRLEDYVEHTRLEYYDAICSVGMIEHVGLGGYRTYFSTIEKFLKPGGTALVHSIVSPISDRPTNRWIDKYIFRGGYAPSVAEITHAVEQSALRISDIYIYGPEHYLKTIESWIENLTHNLDELRSHLRQSGCSEAEADRMSRIWIFYLCGVRNMFAPDQPQTHQIAQLRIRKL